MIRSDLVDAVRQGHGVHSRREARDLVDPILGGITRRPTVGITRRPAVGITRRPAVDEPA